MKVAVFVSAVSVAASLFSDVPDPGIWYTPEDGWRGGNVGAVTIKYSDGTVEAFAVTEDGKSAGLQEMIDNSIAQGNDVAAAALRAIYEALQAQVMVRNMATKLNEFLGQQRTYRVTQGTTSFDVTIPPWTGGGQETDVQSATAKGIPILDGDGKSIVKAGETLSIQNWNNPSTGWTLASQLASKVGGGNAYYEVLARIPGRGGMAYIPIGFGLGGGGGREPDNVTISTNATTGGLELKNWTEMGVERAEEWTIPYSDNAEEGLKWGRFGAFFGAAHFDFNKDGSEVVRLKGWVDGLGPGHYFGTGGEAGAYGFFPVPTPDGASVVTNAEGHLGEVALAGFWDKGTEDGMVPVKKGDGIAWTNVVSRMAVDDATVVTNVPGRVGEAALAGFWDSGTADGMVPMKSGGTLAWRNVGAAVKFIGTDSSEAVVGSGSVTNTVTFAYRADSSNVVVTVEGDGGGNAVIKIGAYWR